MSGAVTPLADTAPRLWTLLAVALLLRLPAVWLHDGYGTVDQMYQSVDPAWHLATGLDWHRTWEWLDGIRSWVYPGALASMLAVAHGLGAEDAAGALRSARLLHALLSLLPLVALWLVLTRWRPVPRPGPVLWLAAASGLGAWVGVQTSAPTLAATLAVTGVLLFHGPGRWPGVLAGVCVGLAFCGRVQDATAGVVLFGAAMLAGRRSTALWFALGTLPPILLQGLVDQLTWGGFLSSAFAYVDLNLTQGAAQKWGTQPFWFYLAVMAGLLLAVPPLLGAAWGALRRGTAVLPYATIAAGGSLLAHSFIQRKSFRFVFAALILVLIVQATGLLADAARRDRWQVVWYRRLVVGLGVATLVMGWFHAPNRGPVQAARFLGAQAAFTGVLAIVDGDVTSVGGFAHLARAAIHVEAVPRERLADWLGEEIERPPWVMVVRHPLPPAWAAQAGLEWAGSFADWPDLRGTCRRFVYRLSPRRLRSKPAPCPPTAETG